MKQTIPVAGRHLVQSITCRAFILMTRSITSLQDALGRSFYGGDAVIFKVTFLQVAHVHWPFFFSQPTQYFTLIQKSYNK